MSIFRKSGFAILIVTGFLLAMLVGCQRGTIVIPRDGEFTGPDLKVTMVVGGETVNWRSVAELTDGLINRYEVNEHKLITVTAEATDYQTGVRSVTIEVYLTIECDEYVQGITPDYYTYHPTTTIGDTIITVVQSGDEVPRTRLSVVTIDLGKIRQDADHWCLGKTLGGAARGEARGYIQASAINYGVNNTYLSTRGPSYKFDVRFTPIR